MIFFCKFVKNIMAYITYDDLCDQFTQKYIDDSFNGINLLERERIISLFSKETESWAAKTLTPFLDISTELEKTGEDRNPLLMPYLARIVGTRIMMRKTANNGNTFLKEQLDDIKKEIEKMYKGKLPMPEMPKTAAYTAGDRNTKIVNGFFDTPKY